MKVKYLLSGIAVVLCLTANAQFKMSKNMLNAGSDLVSAATLTDADVVQYANEYMKWMDTHNQLAKATDEYGSRLKRITSKFESYDGLKLDFKVYLVKDVNAFACANGCVRVCAGLMKIMTDNEILAVVAHEIGHVKNKDSKDAFRTALLTSALKNTVASQSNTAKTLTNSQLGDLAQAVANSSYSRKQESAADSYSYEFLKNNGKNVWALPSAFRKLLTIEDEGGKSSSSMAKLVSSHPETQKRAEQAEERANKDGIPKVEEK